MCVFGWAVGGLPSVRWVYTYGGWCKVMVNTFEVFLKRMCFVFFGIRLRIIFYGLRTL